MEVPPNTKRRSSVSCSHISWANTWKNTSETPQRHLDVHVWLGSIHSSQGIKSIWMSISRCVSKYNVVQTHTNTHTNTHKHTHECTHTNTHQLSHTNAPTHTHHRVLFSHKQEQNLFFFWKINEIWHYHDKQNQPDAEKLKCFLLYAQPRFENFYELSLVLLACYSSCLVRESGETV